MVIVGFLLISKKAFFMVSYFPLTAIDSYRTLHLALGLVDMYSVAASIWAVIKCSNMSFGVCLLDVSWWVSDLFLTITVYWLLISFLVSEDQLYWEALTVCFLFFKWIFAETILWLEDTPSKEEYASQFKVLFIYFLLMNMFIHVSLMNIHII